MDKQKVLEKIKKCLALGESANEHEAAQAIRQTNAVCLAMPAPKRTA